jgi:hypothetical protein
MIVCLLGWRGVVVAGDAPARSWSLPADDPAVEGPPTALLETVRSEHPRLLITPTSIVQLKRLYGSPEGELYRQQILRLLPWCRVPQDRMTSHAWGQEAGLQRMPTLALHYLLTGEPSSLAHAIEYLQWLDALPDWTTNGEGARDEVDSDTAAAFTMFGAAVMWDWLYHDLDPAFRERFRLDLWHHARAMYYGGHLGRNPGGGYWRGVPAYNHRWFRDAGLAMATLAAADGSPGQGWLLGQVRAELEFMAAWLPEDGSNHEGPNYGSAIGLLGMAFQASDHSLGTHLLDHPHFRQVTGYALNLVAPGAPMLCFGDCWYSSKPGGLSPFFLRTAARYHQADLCDGVRHVLAAAPQDENGWSSLVCDDPALQGGQYARLPTTASYSDLGITIVRDSWKATAVIAMFKCGPLGGYAIQGWREEMAAHGGGLPYVNVAHEHPDANSFILLGGGRYLAETDRYSEKPGKVSSSCNTILVNGVGQVPHGRKEGDSWLQPSYDDMTAMGRILAWKQASGVVVSEGEASGSYLAYQDPRTHLQRPALERYRRDFIWVTGSYVLVLDDIRARQPVAITWLMQGVALTAIDAAQGRYLLANGDARCPFQLFADAPFTAEIGISTANDHSRLLRWQQLQARSTARALRWVSIYDPWNHQDLSVSWTHPGVDQATITVRGQGLLDTWKWTSAADVSHADTLLGTRADGTSISVSQRDRPAIPAPRR